MTKTTGDKQVRRVALDLDVAKRYLPAILAGVNIVLILVDILLLSLLPRLASDIVTLRSEILAHQLKLQGTQKLAVDLESTRGEQEKIIRLLPTKQRLLEVIEVFESIKDMVTVKNFSFESEVPQPDAQGFAFLPLSLTLEGSLSQVMSALVRIQKAPFLFTVEQSVVESPEGLSQTVRLNLLMRIYVSEPFTQTQ